MSNTIVVCAPTAGASSAPLQSRRALDRIEGKVVGFIDNTKEQADVILETVAAELKARYGVKDVIIERKEAFSKPARAEMIDSLAQRVQVAAAAVGG